MRREYRHEQFGAGVRNKYYLGARFNSKKNQKPENKLSLHPIDDWLPRLSHIAQFGLFLITIGSLYFTVLPLYQKALLEESIAKKEVELATISKSLDLAYVRLRNYALREFYIAAAPQCSGLFDSVRSGKPVTEKIKTIGTRAERVYAINLPVCFDMVANNLTPLNDLNSKDRKKFQAELNKLTNGLAKIRKISLASYNSISSKVTASDFNSLPNDNYRVKALQLVEKWQGGKLDTAARMNLALEIKKEEIGLEYETAIRDGLKSLRSIQWDAE